MVTDKNQACKVHTYTHHPPCHPCGCGRTLLPTLTRAERLVLRAAPPSTEPTSVASLQQRGVAWMFALCGVCGQRQAPGVCSWSFSVG